MAKRGRKLKASASDSHEHLKGQKFPPVMYGLAGIMHIFGVSKSTASRYANTFLKENGAVTIRGNVILIDTVKALRAFGCIYPESYIKKM